MNVYYVKNKCIVVVFLSLILSLVAPSHVPATEGGGTVYPGGNEDFMAGALPPPGFYYLNYFLYLNSDSYDDLRLPDGTKAKDVFGTDPDFNLDVVANVFRFVYVTPIKVLGANWGVHAILPVLNVDVDAHLPVADLEDNIAGIGDVTINPLIFGWHFDELHVTVGLDIVMPTGSFKKDRVANLGRNYWEFEPVVALTYLTKSGFETSIKSMYDFNTENTETDYTSGQEFHFDYLIGQHVGNWAFGVNGQYYIQTTDDKFDGEASSFDGNKGQAFSIGPAVIYQHKNMWFDLKYQFESIAVENRPESGKLWFRFTYAF